MIVERTKSPFLHMQPIQVVMDDVCMKAIPNQVVGQNLPSLGLIRILTSEVRIGKTLIDLTSFYIVQ
ncbi:hypothetical protein PMIT1303_00196 [Prochlorococcus sp. MIT 1303]|nr:hypothetical protein PMIT1303_00196 [Prochlorococcus sp. MIT 1303]